MNPNDDNAGLMSRGDKDSIESMIQAARLAVKWLAATTGAIVVGTVAVMSFVLQTRAELAQLRQEQAATSSDRASLHAELTSVQIKVATIEGRAYSKP